MVGVGATTVGGVPGGILLRWDGSSWSQLGSATDSYISCLALLSSGELAVGGKTLGEIPAHDWALASVMSHGRPANPERELRELVDAVWDGLRPA